MMAARTRRRGEARSRHGQAENFSCEALSFSLSRPVVTRTAAFPRQRPLSCPLSSKAQHQIGSRPVHSVIVSSWASARKGSVKSKWVLLDLIELLAEGLRRGAGVGHPPWLSPLDQLGNTQSVIAVRMGQNEPGRGLVPQAKALKEIPQGVIPALYATAIDQEPTALGKSDCHCFSLPGTGNEKVQQAAVELVQLAQQPGLSRARPPGRGRDRHRRKCGRSGPG